MVHLTSPILLELEQGPAYVAGVAGARLDADFLRRLLLSATKATDDGSEWSCSSEEDLLCYLLDDTGHVLASNQRLPAVEPGDFLGAVDPQLMRLLADPEQGVFEAFVSRNFQALCPDDLECCSLGVRSVLVPTLDFLVHLMQNLTEVIQNLGYLVVSLFSFLFYYPSPSEAVSEYGFEVPEGLHRCTTNTTTW